MKVITKAVLDMETMKWVSVESYDYEGLIDLCCGPSSQQESLAASEQSFSKLLSANYAQNFGAQSQILQNLTNQFTPIAEAGPSQMGFGPQELAALRTQAGEGTAAEYAKAQQALGTQLSVQGGGAEVLPSGAAAQLRATTAQAAAAQSAQQLLGITEAGYATGRQLWSQATGGLQALSQEYNPLGYAGQTTSATGQAFGEASQIQQMKNQREAGIAGGIASLAGGFLTGGLSNLVSGGTQAGSETGGGGEQFLSGGLAGLGFGQ